jgi:hypothetical protein
MNTKMHAVAVADGGPILFFMTAGQVSDHTRTSAQLASLPDAEWMIGDRSYVDDWFREPLRDKG